MMHATPRRSMHWRHVFYASVITAAVAVVTFWALYIYVSSAQFKARVQHAVVDTLENATGGRVELRSFHWSVLRLGVELDGLTIHGIEAADQLPYLQVDHAELDVKILSFFRPRIGLSRLIVDHPVFHLIVYPDGTTNQPHPRVQSHNASVTQTLFDLAVDQTSVKNGLIVVNDHVVPFELAAGKLGLSVQYVSTPQHYRAALSVQDFTFRLEQAKQSRSKLTADIDLTEKEAKITHLEWQSATSKLTVTGALENFADPVWNARANGVVDLHEVGAVTGYDPLSQGNNGTANIDLHATGKADGEFSIDGPIAAHQGAFYAPWLQLQHVDLQMNAHLDNLTILITDFKSVLDGRGRVEGMLRLTNWLDALPPPAMLSKQETREPWLDLRKFGTKKWDAKKHPAPILKSPPLQALMVATVADMPTPYVLNAVAPFRFDDLGFSSEITGPVRATWHGSGVALDVHGDLTFRPERSIRPDAIPVSGMVKADYLGDTERLDFQQADLRTPGTQVHATGILSLLPEDRNSLMQGTVTVQHLREFDRLIYLLADTTPTSSAKEVGTTASGNQVKLPIHLLGTATFQGKFIGSLMEPQVDGHVDLPRFLTDLHGFTSSHIDDIASRYSSSLQWDSMHADVSYAPSQIEVRHAVVARGATILHADGQLRPVPIGKGNYAFNVQSALVASAHVRDASIADLQSVLGTSYPASGTVSASATVHGTIENLYGTGQVALSGLNVYGQSIPLAASQFSIAGHQMQANQLRIRTAGGLAQGQIAYDYLSHALQGTLTGDHFDLTQIPSLQSKNAAVGGTASVHINAEGTLTAPIVTSSLIMDNVTFNGEPMGQLRAEGQLHGKTLLVTSRAQLLDTHFEAGGTIQLTADLPAQLKLEFTDFNIDPVLQSFTHSGLTGKSSIRGQIVVQGPLKDPRQLQANAHLDRFSVTVNDIALATDGPVLFTAKNGLLELQPVHIKGTDTDLQVQGTANLLGDQRLRGHAEGGINAALAKTFSQDLTASGHIDFSVNARGTIHKPRLVGRVQVTNVAVNLRDVTNGFSAMNGALTFDQDRVVIQQLSAYTGGGKVDFSGFANFRDGLFFDVAANAKEVRIRYPEGVTSTADADIHLDGSLDTLLLRGKITLTRFAISPNIDLGTLAASTQSVSTPPDPTSPLNNIRLDVRVGSSPQLGFQNSFATLAGDVNLHVRGTMENPSVLGRIDITQGKATFAGTQYVLQRGDIVFNNPVTIEPEVNLEATARVRNYDIIIGLNGPTTKLQVNYRSEPPLSQADVLALLALGRTNEEATMYGEQQQVGGDPTTEALLGGALNAAVSNRVQQLFGVASVRVDPNFVGVLGQSTARVTVQQQVGSNLTLVFATSVNTTAQQLLQAQYDITRNLSIIAVRDEADVFSLYFQIRGKKR